MVVGCGLLVVGCWLFTFPIIPQNHKTHNPTIARRLKLKISIHT